MILNRRLTTWWQCQWIKLHDTFARLVQLRAEIYCVYRSKTISQCIYNFMVYQNYLQYVTGCVCVCVCVYLRLFLSDRQQKKKKKTNKTHSSVVCCSFCFISFALHSCILCCYYRMFRIQIRVHTAHVQNKHIYSPHMHINTQLDTISIYVTGNLLDNH